MDDEPEPGQSAVAELDNEGKLAQAAQGREKQQHVLQLVVFFWSLQYREAKRDRSSKDGSARSCHRYRTMGPAGPAELYRQAVHARGVWHL